MPPTKSFSCSFEDCDAVFTKASDLRKHELAHEDPEKLFNCPIPGCTYSSKEKRGLILHFYRHKGLKPFQCPDIVICHQPSDPTHPSESISVEQQCDFRTADPAALTRHRKARHGYKPLRRGRLPASSTPSSSEDLASVHTIAPPISTMTVQRRASLVPADMNASTEDSDRSITHSLRTPRNLSWTGSVAPYPNEQNGAESRDCNPQRSEITSTIPEPYIPPVPCYVTDGVYLGSAEQIQLDSYIPLSLEDIEAMTGIEGCLCPEWMVEAGIEGWDETTLAAHRAYHSV